jgi:hypothetical protein
LAGPSVAMTADIQQRIAVFRTAKQHLCLVQECIDYLNEVNATAALRTLAVRLSELNFRAGGTSDGPPLTELQGGVKKDSDPR